MPLETAQRDLENYIGTNWSETEKQFLNSDNGAAASPEVPLSQGDDAYISVQVMHGRSRAAEVGAGLSGNKRSEGILSILIHVKKGSGTRAVSGYLDTLATLLEYQRIGTVNVKSFLAAPGFPENKWYVTPVLYNFYFDR